MAVTKAMGFHGGDKAKKFLEQMSKKLGSGKLVKVGFLEGSDYPESGTSVPMVAAIQEFGAPKVGIPPRPYFRTMVTAGKAHWGDDLAAIMKATNCDSKQALAQMGFIIKEELQQSIIDTNAPALSPITLMLRKMRKQDQTLVVTGKTVGEAARRVAKGESTSGVSVKPLVDSGYLLDSVDFQVY